VIRSCAVLFAASILAAGGAAAQVQQYSFVCDLNGAPGQLTMALQYFAQNGVTWGPGPNSGITGVIPTGDYTIYTAGELRSASGYYTFTGEGEYAEFVDHVQNQRFQVRFVEQQGGLVLVINPFGEGPATHFCQRSR